MILNNSRLVVANRAIYVALNCLSHRQVMKCEIPRSNSAQSDRPGERSAGVAAIPDLRPICSGRRLGLATFGV